MGRGRAADAGFTYLGMLFLIALVGLALASAGTLASFERRREQEAELLFVGHQFRSAIARYYQAGAGGGKQYPPNLEALLQDPRFPGVRRYLRRIYRDPVTGGADWGVVEAPTGGVMGVFSRSTHLPLKVGNFPAVDQDFEGKGTYSEWKFVYLPQQDGGRVP